MRNDRIASKTIKKTMSSEPLEVGKQDIKMGIVARRNKFSSIGEMIANDKFCYKNWMIQEVRQSHPSEPNLWYVDRMFPDAEGGKLLVDEAMKEWEIELCTKKAKILKSLGYKYLFVTPQMTVCQALEQLGATG